MPEILLRKLREAAGLTRTGLSYDARVHPARIGQIENLRARPYDIELARIAAALGFEGDPAALLEVVDDDST